MPSVRFSTSEFWMMPLLAILSVACLAQAPVPEPVTDQETELGQAMYKHLRERVEIIESSPLYDALKPVAKAISRVAQPRYPHPFKFFLVHEAQPNAFATPGGNVYVVDRGNRRIQVFDPDGTFLREIHIDVPLPPVIHMWMGNPPGPQAATGGGGNGGSGLRADRRE